ncbi:high nitrogen upregulated cytochrome P450 monooxygenase 2, partial [Lactifluus volemus]
HLYFRHLEPRSTSSLIALLFLVPSLLSVPIYHVIQRSFAAVALAFTTYGTSLIFFTLAYRLSPFHPLAKFPGPILPKLSKWWGAYVSVRGDPHRYLKKLHDRYGDIVRVGPNELSIRDACYIHQILGQGGLPRGPRWDGPPSLIAHRDPIKHMNHRKRWDRGFSSAALKEYEVIVAKRSRQLVSCLEDNVRGSGQKAAVLDMAAWMSYFTTDLMGDMTFGGGFELMRAGGDVDGIWALFESSIRYVRTVVVGHIPYMQPVVNAIMKLTRATAGRRRSPRLLRTFGKERALKRLQMGANRKDLFYYLSGEDLPESERPSIDAVAQDGALAILAGSDTASSALTAIIYYLLCNPAVYERLQDEVDVAFPSEEEPLDMTRLSCMEWLNGCINEGLRLQPPVPSGSQRSLGKGKGSRVLGKLVIPEETQVFLHTYSIHRDPRYFYTPEEFLPERWFSTDALTREHNTAAFFPFSYGPAICAGKHLALMEMRMVLCWVLRRFRFSKAPDFSYEEWEEKIQDWFVVHHDPLLVNVSLRG